MWSTGVSFLWRIPSSCSRMAVNSRALELDTGGLPSSRQIGRSSSITEPVVVAIRVTSRYWAGCRRLAAARKEVDLPDPTSPVMTVTEPICTA